MGGIGDLFVEPTHLPFAAAFPDDAIGSPVTGRSIDALGFQVDLGILGGLGRSRRPDEDVARHPAILTDVRTKDEADIAIDPVGRVLLRLAEGAMEGPAGDPADVAAVFAHDDLNIAGRPGAIALQPADDLSGFPTDDRRIAPADQHLPRVRRWVPEQPDEMDLIGAFADQHVLDGRREHAEAFIPRCSLVDQVRRRWIALGILGRVPVQSAAAQFGPGVLVVEGPLRRGRRQDLVGSQHPIPDEGRRRQDGLATHILGPSRDHLGADGTEGVTQRLGSRRTTPTDREPDAGVVLRREAHVGPDPRSRHTEVPFVVRRLKPTGARRVGRRCQGHRHPTRLQLGDELVVLVADVGFRGIDLGAGPEPVVLVVQDLALRIARRLAVVAEHGNQHHAPVGVEEVDRLGMGALHGGQRAVVAGGLIAIAAQQASQPWCREYESGADGDRETRG